MRSGANPKKIVKRAPSAEVVPSSGNAFADLGLPRPKEHLAKAQLVQRICETVRKQKLTQTAAATLLGVDQPKVSALMRGKFESFSMERLFRFLNALGRDVEIVIRPARRAKRSASTRVLAS
jgi:predicted XRE-type DNA-binding protein